MHEVDIETNVEYLPETFDFETDNVPSAEETSVYPAEDSTESNFYDDIEDLENTSESTELESGTLEQADTVEYISQIAGDVRIIMFLALFTFCWNAMRSFRKHTLKGGC